MQTTPVTLGVIVGNRDFFPDSLIAGARAGITALFGEMGIGAVMVDEQTTSSGDRDARRRVEVRGPLPRPRRSASDGVLVALPNFGDEKAVVDTLRASGLRVPILVQAERTTSPAWTWRAGATASAARSRSATTSGSTAIPSRSRAATPCGLGEPDFRRDLEWFVAVCRVVRGLRRARLGAIGARPAAFNTVRSARRSSSGAGISVVTRRPLVHPRDVQRLPTDDPRVATKGRRHCPVRRMRRSCRRRSCS